VASPGSAAVLHGERRRRSARGVGGFSGGHGAGGGGGGFVAVMAAAEVEAEAVTGKRICSAMRFLCKKTEWRRAGSWP